jgi:RND family efflux transporter MFP subunit
MKRLAPLLILITAALIALALILLRPAPNEVIPERPLTRIEIITVMPETVQLSVQSQGTLMPKIESELAVEVSGRIIEMAPDFRAGGRFKKGDILFKIDPADYEAAVAARAAELASAGLSLAQEEALAEQAAADWSAMGQGEPSPLTLRKPQLAQAHAMVRSAEAALKRAKRDLNRTEIRAPYDGMVLSKSVDLGQYVVANPTLPIARIFSSDTGEVRLPLTQEEASLLNDPTETQSRVALINDSPQGPIEWAGRFVRYEATIDPSSRLIHAIAEVANPFEQGMRRGMFLKAEISGQTLEQAFVIPRYALRGSSSVYLVTESNRLITREVTLAQTDTKRAIVASGLEAGDRVVTSPIAYYVENMPVEIIEAP